MFVKKICTNTHNLVEMRIKYVMQKKHKYKIRIFLVKIGKKHTSRIKKK